MNADEKSDKGMVPMKQPNKEGAPSAEAVEGKTLPEGNGGKTTAARTLGRDTASNGLDAVRQAARRSKSVRFTALLHHITVDLLTRSYFALERDSAPGIDGVTWQAYGGNLKENLTDLHDRIHKGSYRAHPARRTYIPKADGSQRPLAILCLQDKVVQQAVAKVLEAIYEEDFIGFSYDPIPTTGSWVKQVLQGHLNSYAVSGNHPSMWWFCNQVRWYWLKSLRRRSQKAFLSWERFIRLVDRFLPPIKVLHPLPLHRFDARTRGRSPVR